MPAKKSRHARHRSDWQKADHEFFQEAYPSSSSNPLPSADPYAALPSRTLKKGENQYAEITELDDKIAKIRRFALPMRDKRRQLREAKDEPSPKSEIVGPVAAHRQRTCNKARVHWQNNRKIFIPFSSLLKSIQGRFGTGLGSYFIFLRWLLTLNFVMSLLLFCFVVVPVIVSNENVNSQASELEYCPLVNNSVECCTQRYVNNASDLHDFLHLATGSGWMEMTHLFYGFYPDSKLYYASSGVYYSFPLAYMLTCAMCFFVSFVLIVYEAAKRFRESLVSEKGNFHVYCNVVFASWDFCIKDEKAAAVEHNVIANELRMLLQADRLVEQRKNLTSGEKWRLYFKRFCGHVIALGILGGCGFAIYYASEFAISAEKRQFNETSFVGRQASDFVDKMPQWVVEYIPSTTITVLNILVPTFFFILGKMEEYSPDRQVQFQVLRTIGLRLSSIFFLMASFYTMMCATEKDENGNECTKCRRAPPCWETYVGQELYKLTIVDLVGSMVVVCVFGPVRKAFASLLSSSPKLQAVVQVDFDLPRQVVDLVYSQSLCWLSLLFSPLSPAINVVKFFIFFHLKHFQLKFVCAPSLFLYRASRSNALFMGALLLSFIAVTAPLGLLALEIQPSRSCGPFRGKAFMWEVVVTSIDQWPVSVQSVLTFFSTAGFVVPAIIVLILFLYYYWAMAAAHRSMVSRLQEQLILENRDKQFLLARLNALLISQKSSIGRSTNSEATPLRST